METDGGLLAEKIRKLKRRRDACILAHNFQALEVQACADFVGGTKELYAEATKRPEKVLLVASVYPMAQIIAFLVPQKTVLSPDPEAGCPMVKMLDSERLRETKKARQGAKVAAYFKASSEALAMSDYCWSYSEAVEFMKNRRNIILIPDMHFARNVARAVRQKIPSIGGFCPPHVKILPRDIEELRKKRPKAVVLVHPECRSEVAALAHKILESGDMVRHIRNSDEKRFIVASEVSLVERLAKENPGKEITPASSRALCQSMKRISLEKIYWSLEDMIYPVNIEEEYGTKVRNLLRKLYKGRKPMAF
jgi:quinolinate synthase